VAISAIAASLEQKVWVRTMGMPLYPNLFIGLVGPPGAGKTLPIIGMSRLFASLEEHFISPSSISNAALTDCLMEAKRRIVRPALNPPYTEFNSLYVISRELGVLLPGYDTEFMSSLNDLYDCGLYSQRRRGGGIKFEIPNAQINLLAATTPSFLNGLLPEGAWQQGFTSRTIFVYSGASQPKNIFDDITGDDSLSRALKSDLKIISELYGKLEFTEPAVSTIKAWHMSGGPPAPEHPKLTSYVTRRTEHLLKLSMVAAIVRSSSTMTIELEDFQTALDWLLEAESFMPDIFRAMRSGGDSTVIEETWHFVWQIFTKEKKPVQEHRVIGFVHERTPSHNVMKILDLMVRSKLLIYDPVNMTYSPAPRVPR
jgi:hypothetical protein